jgi:arylsulfatase A-like enzyme/Flp pilus assembly protein TadD
VTPSTRTLAALLLLATLSACSEPERAAETEMSAPEIASAEARAPVNVLLITMDTTRADALGAYGQSLPSSPRIDGLASRGVMFQDAMTVAPTTLPSHATIFTGKFSFAHGARANIGYVLASGNVTLAERLKEHGYHTAAEVAAPVIGRRTQLNQGFDRYRDLDSYKSKPKMVQVQAGGVSRQIELEERDAEDITSRGIEFLRSRQEPFFLWLHYFDPHWYYAPPGEHERATQGSGYHGEVHFADAEIGRVLDEIDRLRLSGRTLVVLTSDHGEGLGQHGEATHSYFIYDTTLRVPLIFAGTGVTRAGASIEGVVRTADIAPTILDVLELPPLENIHGVSLRQMLQGDTPLPNLVAYGESFEPKAMFGCSALRTVIDGDLKYIHKVEPQLYDLSSDPDETTNLAAERPEDVARLREKLRELLGSAPKAAEDARVEVTGETLAQLQALGYVGAVAAAPAGLDELADFEPGGPDPAALIDDVKKIADGWAALVVEDWDGAAALFQDLVDRHPDSFTILHGLVRSLRKQKEYARAVPYIRKAIEVSPENLGLRIDLGATLVELGDLEGAQAALRSAVLLRPCDPVGRGHLLKAMQQAGRWHEALALLKEGVRTCPQTPEFRNDLAWLLATSPVDEIRDGAEAVRLAKLAVEATRGERPDALDTLAAAYAEEGDFANATRTGRQALDLIRARNLPPHIVQMFEAHQAAFEAGKPIRE